MNQNVPPYPREYMYEFLTSRSHLTLVCTFTTNCLVVVRQKQNKGVIRENVTPLLKV